jgi:hypothetical protein
VTKHATEYLLSLGDNVLTLPLDALLGEVMAYEGHIWLVVIADAANIEGVTRRTIRLRQSFDLMPEPVGKYIGSKRVNGISFHVFEVE